jgi:hypothetical protein
MARPTLRAFDAWRRVRANRGFLVAVPAVSATGVATASTTGV